MTPSIIEYKAHYSKRIDFDPEWWMKHVPEPSSWTELNISRFLRLYKSHPALWDPSNPGYNSDLARRLSYRHIAQKLQLNEVDERECIKLVQDLKKRFIKEKEFNRVSEKERPEWFNIIDSIVKRVLDLSRGKESTSSITCENCSCVAEPSVDSFAECQDCCAQQGFVAPCRDFGSPQGSLGDAEQKTKQDKTRSQLEPRIPSDRPGVNVVMLNLQSCYHEEKKEDSCGCPVSTDESGDDSASGSNRYCPRQSEQSSESDLCGSYVAYCFQDLSDSEEDMKDSVNIRPGPFTNLWDEPDELYDKPISLVSLPDDLDSLVELHDSQMQCHKPNSSIFCPLKMSFFKILAGELTKVYSTPKVYDV